MKIWPLLFLVACVTPRIYPQGPLKEQILVFRTKYVGLTSGSCMVSNSKGECVEFKVLEYNLEDAEVRRQLRELQFICKVGEKRFTICKDKPGLCHRTYRRWFIIGRTPLDEYIAQSENTRLINMGTICFNEDEYPYNEI